MELTINLWTIMSSAFSLLSWHFVFQLEVKSMNCMHLHHLQQIFCESQSSLHVRLLPPGWDLLDKLDHHRVVPNMQTLLLHTFIAVAGAEESWAISRLTLDKMCQWLWRQWSSYFSSLSMIPCMNCNNFVIYVASQIIVLNDNLIFPYWLNTF